MHVDFFFLFIPTNVVIHPSTLDRNKVTNYQGRAKGSCIHHTRSGACTCIAQQVKIILFLTAVLDGTKNLLSRKLDQRLSRTKLIALIMLS